MKLINTNKKNLIRNLNKFHKIIMALLKLSLTNHTFKRCLLTKAKRDWTKKKVSYRKLMQNIKVLKRVLKDKELNNCKSSNYQIKSNLIISTICISKRTLIGLAESKNLVFSNSGRMNSKGLLWIRNIIPVILI